MRKKKFNIYGEPTKPYEPLKPQETIKNQVLITSVDVSNKMSRDELTKLFEHSFDYMEIYGDGEDNSYALNLYKEENEPNPHFHALMAAYNKGLKKYEKDMKEYKEKKKEWDEAKREYEAEQKAKQDAWEKKELARLLKKFGNPSG